jgi:hypothetical protein
VINDLEQAIKLTGFNKLGLELIFGDNLERGVELVVSGKISRAQAHEAYWDIADTRIKVNRELGVYA